MSKFCQHPDRDVPALKCGYPFPCPYHTVEIDASILDDLDVAKDAFIDGRNDEGKRIMKDAVTKKIRAPKGGR